MPANIVKSRTNWTRSQAEHKTIGYGDNCPFCQERKRRTERYNDKNGSRRMNYKGRDIFMTRNPRIGICSNCRGKVGFDIKRTCIYYTSWNDEDPLKGAIELCISCRKIDYHLKKNSKSLIEKN